MTPQDIPALLVKYGSLKAAYRAGAASWRQLRNHYTAAVEQGLIEAPRLGRKTNKHLKAPTVTVKQRAKALRTKRERHHTYLLTCAQNNTHIHEKTWQNLLALAEDRDAKIFVSTFLYAARSHWQKNLDKGHKKSDSQDELWYDPAVVPYINNERVEIAKGLVWCGELNIIPTAVSPLSGLEVFTARASMVVPHVTVAMESIAGLGGDGAKLNFTTGTVTQRNYIQRKEGFKGEFHHSYGALLVEVDESGHWWCRQLNADSDGTIYDLDTCVKDGKVTTGHRVEAITLGDTHNEVRDETVYKATFCDGDCLVETLDPKFIFVHDVIDMGRRGHHNIKDPYAMMLAYATKKESVRDAVKGVAHFLGKIANPKRRQIVVVNSNHDRHLDRWLTEVDGRYDPVNADYWGLLNHWKTNYIMSNEHIPDMLQLAILMPDGKFETRNNLIFLDGNSSFVICPKSGGGIECALHGDRGANGSRGSRRQFARALGRRSNIGHSHSAGITQGCYQAGTNSEMDLGYNKGLSAWTHSDIITYANGKRAIVTFFNGKWRA